uniref:Uncharacterized protein n=1 Tax=Pararge aegeria TaxID=116150 RepID=S4NU72_9NEOP
MLTFMQFVVGPDCLIGLVVSMSNCRSQGSGFFPRVGPMNTISILVTGRSLEIAYGSTLLAPKEHVKNCRPIRI